MHLCTSKSTCAPGWGTNALARGCYSSCNVDQSHGQIDCNGSNVRSSSWYQVPRDPTEPSTTHLCRASSSYLPVPQSLMMWDWAGGSQLSVGDVVDLSVISCIHWTILLISSISIYHRILFLWGSCWPHTCAKNELTAFNSIFFDTICCGPGGLAFRTQTETHYILGTGFRSLIIVFLDFLEVQKSL